MNETESRVDLNDVGEGWRAVMSGRYWNGSISGIKGVELECIGPIGPENSPDFKPSKVMLRLPQGLENSELRGKLIVFMAEDIDYWIAPEPN